MKTFNLKYPCKVGQSAKENWELLDKAKDHHLFFHLSFYPSCYVILECDNEPEIDVIKEAANICRLNTKYKKLRNLKVDYCFCNNLIKGAKKGEVIFKSFRKVKKIKLD